MHYWLLDDWLLIVKHHFVVCAISARLKATLLASQLAAFRLTFLPGERYTWRLIVKRRFLLRRRRARITGLIERIDVHFIDARDESLQIDQRQDAYGFARLSSDTHRT